MCVWGGGLAGGWGSLPRAVGSVDGAVFYPEIGLKKEEWGDRQWWIQGGRGFNPPPPPPRYFFACQYMNIPADL